MTSFSVTLPPAYSGEQNRSEHHVAVHISAPPPPQNPALLNQPSAVPLAPAQQEVVNKTLQETAEGHGEMPIPLEPEIEGAPTEALARQRTTWCQRGIKVGMTAGCAVVGLIAQQVLLQLNHDDADVANAILQASCISAISPAISFVIDDVLGKAAFRRINTGIGALFSASLIDTFQGHNVVGKAFSLTLSIGGALIPSYPIFRRCVRGEHLCPWWNG